VNVGDHTADGYLLGRIRQRFAVGCGCRPTVVAMAEVHERLNRLIPAKTYPRWQAWLNPNRYDGATYYPIGGLRAAVRIMQMNAFDTDRVLAGCMNASHELDTFFAAPAHLDDGAAEVYTTLRRDGWTIRDAAGAADAIGLRP
jgi:hypothetical protein